MPASPIRKLVPYAEAAKKKGVRVYHLNIGQPDIETPKMALDAVRHFDFKVLEYSHSAGNESYRRKLAAYYRRVGIDVDYTQIIITTGGSEAILFGFMSCLDAGDEVIIPEPFYANYNGFRRCRRCCRQTAYLLYKKRVRPSTHLRIRKAHHAPHKGHRDLQPQ